MEYSPGIYIHDSKDKRIFIVEYKYKKFKLISVLDLVDKKEYYITSKGMKDIEVVTKEQAELLIVTYAI